MKQDQTENTAMTFSNQHTYKALLLCSGSQTSQIFNGSTIFVDLEAIQSDIYQLQTLPNPKNRYLNKYIINHNYDEICTHMHIV